MRFRTLLFVAVYAGSMLQSALSQTATGVITGVVTDASGATVSGTKITLVHQKTNQTREQVANSAGIYEFRALPRGLYTLQAEKPGFKKGEVRGVQLTVAQTLQLDMRLELGQLSDSVTVEANASQVQ